MNTEQKAKAYDEALEKAKAAFDMAADKDLVGGVVRTIFPELYESEDERIRKYLIEELKAAKSVGELKFIIPQPTREECIAYLEKQKECVVDNNKTSAEEDERIRARLIEYFQGFLEGYEDCYKDGGCVKWEGLDVKSILAWLEKQKETANSFTDGIIEVRSFRRGMEEGRKLETQKEPGIKWLKSDNVKNPDKPYVDKAGMFYTTDGRMCYASEIEQQKEQKHPNGCFTCDEYKKGYEEGRRNGFTAGYNKAMKEVEQKEQKPVVTLGETYHVDTLGTQQVIAGKMPQKPAWSEEDENAITTAIRACRYMTENFENSTKQYEDAIERLKSLRPVKQEWSEKYIAGVFEKVGLAKIVREQGNNALTNALQDAMLELSKTKPAEWNEEDIYITNVLEYIVGKHRPDEIFKIGNKQGVSAYKICSWLKSLPERFNLQSKQKQNDYITPHKEFFKFIYDRLINVHKENPNVDYMRSFKERLNNLSFGEKQEWSEEDEENFKWFDKFFRAESVVSGGKDIPQDKYLWFKSRRPQPKQEWSEEDENKIESIKGLITMGKFVDTNTIKTIWKLLDSLRPQPKVEWSEEDKKRLKRVLEIVDRHGTIPVFDGKVEKRFNAEYIWLKSLPERFNLQPKQEWSEEDEDMLNSCISSIEEAKENRYAYKETDGDTSYDHEIAWLKSLRPSWKPSEEQMKALEECGECKRCIKELYEQLKKL